MRVRNILFILVLVLGVFLFAIYDFSNNKASGIESYKYIISAVLLLMGVIYVIKTHKLK